MSECFSNYMYNLGLTSDISVAGVRTVSSEIWCLVRRGKILLDGWT